MLYKPLTIFGQMVVDHVVHTMYPYESANLKGVVMKWDPITGKIVIPERSFLSTPYIMPPEAVRLVFELPPGEYRSGDKIDATSVTPLPFEQVAKDYQQATLSQLGFPRQVPGGGGTNVSYALYNVFGNIQKSYISIYTKNHNSVIEEALAPVFPSSGLVLLKEDPGYAINIIIEGIAGDRFIIRSPRRRDIRIRYYEREGDVCMVNTCYSWFAAINGLLEALRAERGAVIACTEPLCDDTPIPEELGHELADIVREKTGDYAKPAIASIRQFIHQFVMRRGNNLLYVFNEVELAHLIKETRPTFDVLDLDNDPLFSGMIRGLIWLRGLQGGAKPEMIVTLGKHGALYLDKKDDLHYCRAMTDREMQRVAPEKKAIGDLFAAVVLALLYGKEDRGVVRIVDPTGAAISQSCVPSVLVAACSAADAGVYDGFMYVTPTSVNSLIQRNVGHYSYFGPIQNINPADYAGKVRLVLERKIERLRKGQIREACSLNQLVDPGLLTR